MWCWSKSAQCPTLLSHTYSITCLAAELLFSKLLVVEAQCFLLIRHLTCEVSSVQQPSNMNQKLSSNFPCFWVFAENGKRCTSSLMDGKIGEGVQWVGLYLLYHKAPFVKPPTIMSDTTEVLFAIAGRDVVGAVRDTCLIDIFYTHNICELHLGIPRFGKLQAAHVLSFRSIFMVW